MKITICGSTTFKEKMLEYQEKLQELWHEAIVHPDYGCYIRWEKQDVREIVQKEHARAKRENDYIRRYHNAIMWSDGILVLNFDKKWIVNYIGCNTLMEIASAYNAGKKVFLMNPIPQQDYIRDEINAIDPIIINWDLNQILPAGRQVK